jgi:hypothetical protein
MLDLVGMTIIGVESGKKEGWGRWKEETDVEG